MNTSTINFLDFQKVDIRVGTIISIDEFPEARTPAFILEIDFGDELGIKKSSAQITANYDPDNLMNKQIIAVTNFPPKQIGPHLSEVLVLGLPDNDESVVLVSPDNSVSNGKRLY
jgi:tRNA-binding protein